MTGRLLLLAVLLPLSGCCTFLLSDEIEQWWTIGPEPIHVAHVSATRTAGGVLYVEVAYDDGAVWTGAWDPADPRQGGSPFEWLATPGPRFAPPVPAEEGWPLPVLTVRGAGPSEREGRVLVFDGETLTYWEEGERRSSLTELPRVDRVHHHEPWRLLLVPLLLPALAVDVATAPVQAVALAVLAKAGLP